MEILENIPNKQSKLYTPSLFRKLTATLGLTTLLISSACTQTPEAETPTTTTQNCGESAIKIGEQCWMKLNLNIGSMVESSLSQTDNNTIEKYCYDNNPENCETYGGLYQWDEMMQYTLTESTQGICNDGFHVPSDQEWKTLEISLGMSPEDANLEGNRGTDQGTQLLEGGTSGLEFPISGYSVEGAFYGINFRTWIWSSTEASSTRAWLRGPQIPQVSRDNDPKIEALPVRCVRNVND